MLDGVRGLAAVVIAFRHAPFLWATPGAPAGFLRESYLAVDLFFILSGFVLEHAYRGRIENGLGPLAFMRLRLMRLYPLYGLALACSVACLLLTHRFRADWQIGAAAVFLPTPAGNPAKPLYPLNYPAWSLFFELVANLGFAAIGRRLTDRVLTAVVVASGSLLCWGAIGGYAGFAGDLDAGAAWGGFVAGLLRVAFGFFAGVLVHRLWRASRRTVAVHPALLMACLVSVLACSPSEQNRVWFDLAAVLVVFPPLVFLAAHAAPESRPSRDIMRWLGSVSYAVYVLQAPIYFALAALFGGFGASHPATAGVAAVAVVLSLSHLASSCFDTPVRRWLGRLVPTAISTPDESVVAVVPVPGGAR